MINMVIEMNEYELFLVLDEQIKDKDYFSNKHLVTGGDLIFLDDLTTGYNDAQDLSDEINHTNNRLNITGAIIISKKEHLDMINNKEQLQPKKTIKVMFQEHRDFYEKLMGRDGPTKEYIESLIFRDYYEYLCIHTNEIKNSLIKNVRIPGVPVDEYTTPTELNQIFYAYYRNKNNPENIPYKKIRDTYLELYKYQQRKTRSR